MTYLRHAAHLAAGAVTELVLGIADLTTRAKRAVTA